MNNEPSTQQPEKKSKKGLIILICIIAFIAIVAIVASNSGEKGGIKDTTISMSEFNQIKTGMSYSEVVNIIGTGGELMSEVDIGYSEYATRIYTWKGNGTAGSNANVTFQGGKVVSKAQIGLR